MNNQTQQRPNAPSLAHTLAQTDMERVNSEERDAIWDEHIRLRSQLFQEHPLDYLFLEVTRACNLSCAYCGSTCGLKRQSEELTASEFIDVLRQIAKDFSAPDIMVAVTGGEPLTKPGIFDLFRELQRLSFPYGMVSNGWLLTEEVARKVVELGMASITLSMDAPPPLNDRLRGEGTSQAVFKAVESLHNAGFQGKLEIFSTITKPAIPLLDQTRAIVSAMRVPFWRVSPVMPLGRAARRADLLPGPAEIRQRRGLSRQSFRGQRAALLVSMSCGRLDCWDLVRWPHWSLPRIERLVRARSHPRRPFQRCLARSLSSVSRSIVDAQRTMRQLRAVSSLRRGLRASL